MHFDLKEFIASVGYLGVFAMVFAESGLLVGFFLPGDSLLFTAGFLASSAGKAAMAKSGVEVELNIFVLAIGCFIAAVAGDTVGYWFGHQVGQRLFQREDSRFFKKKNLHKAQDLYEKHGAKIIILARFMPIVRTFAPIVAGIGTMTYSKFVTFNVVGGFLWAVGVTVAGYFLGELIPDVDKYLLPIVFLIVLISVAPPLWHMWKDRQQEKREALHAEAEPAPMD